MAKKVSKKVKKKKAPSVKQKFKLGSIKKVALDEETPSRVYNVYAGYTNTCTWSCCGATFCC